MEAQAQVFHAVGLSSELLGQISSWSCHVLGGSLINLAWVVPKRERVSTCFSLCLLNIASRKIKLKGVSG